MKVTKEWIDELCDSDDAVVRFHHFPATTVTVCLLTLPSGFSLVGSSACIHPEDYDSELGMSLALDDAKDHLWEFEGYHRMAEAKK
jgi:hypothetical protein